MIPLYQQSQIAELKRFALTMMWVFPAIFMGVLPWLFSGTIPWWPAVLSLVLALLYLVYPKWLYYPYRVWMAIASVIGWINTKLVLGLAFYGLILPIGLILRLFNKLQYKAHAAQSGGAESFYIIVKDNTTKENLEEPF